MPTMHGIIFLNDKTRSGRTIPVLFCAVLIAVIAVIAAGIMTTDETYASERGPGKYKGKLYFLNANGKPATARKERVLTAKGRKYYVLKNGRIRKGWNVVGDDLYYFGRKTGRMIVNKTIAGITLLPDGKAQKSYKNSKGKKVQSLDVAIRIKCIKVLKRRGAYNKSKAAQLRAAWTYMTDRKTFHYSKIYPNMKDPQWTKKYANRMLSTHGGNCYGYACTLSAFAWTIGFDPYVVAGRCPGGRDGARDGFTRHCVLKINGRWYDPEYWAIYRSHYLYGARGLSYTFKNRHRAVRFKKVKGSVTPAVKTISGNLKKIGGKYYYFNSKGKAKKGVYYIKGKLYRFSKKGKYGWCMTPARQKKVQKAAKKGKPYSTLVKLIGKAKRYNDECDEYSSRTYIYPHIAVNVRRKSGKWVIRKVMDIKAIQL